MKKLLLTIFAVIATAIIPAHAADDDVQVLLDADFTVFTDGSESSPKTLISSDVKAKVPGVNYASSVAAAGGYMLVKSSGYIEFSAFSELPSSSGCTLRVTAEVKMGDNYGGVIQYSKGYTGSPVNAIVETDEWTTVTVLLPDFGNGSTSRLKMAPYLSVSGFYIKSLKVEYSPNFMPAPEAYLPNDADGTSFTASCGRVSGATAYEADVFSLDGDGNPVYFVENKTLTALGIYSNPSAKITGLDPDTKYYYVARAKNAAGAVSENSEVVEVIKCISSIDAPEALAASNVTENGFTANWTPVENAVAYNVNVYSNETLTADADASVFEEDFSGFTEGTLSSIGYPSRSNIDKYTKVPGWAADGSIASAAGYYVFYPINSTGMLVTPVIDLSANNGEFSVTLKVAAGSFGSFYVTDNTITAEIVEGDFTDADDEDWTIVETAEAQAIANKNFTDYKFNFTKGSANSRVRITYTIVSGSTYKLYVDELNVSQTLPAGSVVEKQLLTKNVEGVTSADIELAMNEGQTYMYDVIAIGQTVIGSDDKAVVGEILSKQSNRVKVDAGAGVDNVAVDEAGVKAWKAGDGVLGVNGSDITVCDIAGRVLYKEQLPADIYTLNINVRGIVIVVVDGNAYKMIL